MPARVLISCGALFQLVMRIGPHGMAGEMGVIFGVPQPFTIRSSRLTQAVCISNSHLMQILRSNTEDANTVHANFVQYLRSLKEQVAADWPFFKEVLSKTDLVGNRETFLFFETCSMNSHLVCNISCLPRTSFVSAPFFRSSLRTATVPGWFQARMPTLAPSNMKRPLPACCRVDNMDYE